jgi:trans-2-enoyl-CoA reductase
MSFGEQRVVIIGASAGIGEAARLPDRYGGIDESLKRRSDA